MRRRWTERQSNEMAQRYRDGAGLLELARHFSCDPSAIKTQLRHMDVPMRAAHRPHRRWSPQEVGTMVRLWNEGESQSAIAREVGTTPLIVSRTLKQAGIKVTRRAKNAIGSAHGMWKGGRVGIKGYVGILVRPDHPYASMAMVGGYVLEHRLVMAESLGRPLRSDETVHHINGDPADNRIENLQLRNGKHGKGVVMVCRACGSHDIETRRLPD